MDNPEWHLTKEEIQTVIRKVKEDNPDPQPYTIYLALLVAQRQKEDEMEQRFARSLVTGELQSIDYFEGQITSVTGISEVPPVFEEAFKEGQK